MLEQTIRSLTDAVRNPLLAVPDGLDPKRLGVYRRLVLNNVFSILSANFPVAERCLGVDFRGLAVDFLENHRAHTPLFTELPQELMAFVSERPDPRWPFLLELLHYEWIELKLALSDAVECKPAQGDLALSAYAEPLAYLFPVQQIQPGFLPLHAGAAPTLLLAYRDRHFQVQFHALQPAAYCLLASLGASGPMSADLLIAHVLEALALVDADSSERATQTLAHFIRLGAVVAG